jgi:hypothetical protein
MNVQQSVAEAPLGNQSINWRKVERKHHKPGPTDELICDLHNNKI